jgi:hypothetical protein
MDDQANGITTAEIPPPAPRRTVCRDLLGSLRAGARLVFLRPVRAEWFAPSAEVFAVLSVLNLVLLFVLGVASIGFNGEFNGYEVPRALLFVPATLLFALLAARAGGGAGSMLQIAVALVAAGLVLSLLFGVAGVLMLHLPRRLVGLSVLCGRGVVVAGDRGYGCAAGQGRGRAQPADDGHGMAAFGGADAVVSAELSVDAPI